MGVLTAVEVDARIDRLWREASKRGYRVDVRAMMIARRENPRDAMHKQITDHLRPGARVHPRINAAGAVTGRMTVTGPNLQGLSPAYRRVLLADPGYALVGCDLSHVEPSVAAALSGDEALIAAVRPGRDPYVDLARVLFDAPDDDIDDEDPRRKAAKTALLALLYGEGTPALAMRLAGRDPSVEEVSRARKTRTAVLRQYPRLATWIADLERAAASGGELQTWGRRVIADVGVGDDGRRAIYKATNYVVQGSAADFFKRLTLRVDDAMTDAGMPGALWLPIHDELVVMVPTGRAEEARAILGAEMSAHTMRGVPIFGKAKVLGERFRK